MHRILCDGKVVREADENCNTVRLLVMYRFQTQGIGTFTYVRFILPLPYNH